MRMSSEVLLTFLLNAVWQVALIAALAAVGSWLLRNAFARYHHWVWVSALCLAFIVPTLTSSRAVFEALAPSPCNCEHRLLSGMELVQRLSSFGRRRYQQLRHRHFS